MPCLHRTVACNLLRQSSTVSHTHSRVVLTPATFHVTLRIARRHQASDQFHRYLHHPHVEQPDDVDGLVQTKAEQQKWLNTEQWDGYSDTYLCPFMQYPTTVELNKPQLTAKHTILYKCLALVYELYGTLAEDLQQLHDDPLHPQFHLRIARLRREREKIADAIDACYAGLHPTVKTIYDAYLVRRYYHLADWITYVEQKRATLINRLTPEMMSQMQRARHLSESFIRRLKQLEVAFLNNPILALLTNEEMQSYTHDEMVMLQQKAAYFRKMHRLGVNQRDSDIHTV